MIFHRMLCSIAHITHDSHFVSQLLGWISVQPVFVVVPSGEKNKLCNVCTFPFNYRRLCYTWLLRLYSYRAFARALIYLPLFLDRMRRTYLTLAFLLNFSPVKWRPISPVSIPPSSKPMISKPTSDQKTKCRYVLLDDRQAIGRKLWRPLDICLWSNYALIT